MTEKTVEGRIAPSKGNLIGGEARIIVENCPYCGQTHRHMYNQTTDSLQKTILRKAECGRGDYTITLDDVPVSARTDSS